MTSRTKFLALLLLLAVVFLPGRYSLQSLATSNDRADDIRAQAAEIDAKAAEAEEVLANQAAFDARRAPYVAAIPGDPQLEELIDALDAAALSHDVQWESGSPSDQGGSDSPQVSQWRIEMSVTGSAPNVAAFLDEVRSLPRLVVVDSIDLSNPSDSTVSANLEARFFSTGDLK